MSETAEADYERLKDNPEVEVFDVMATMALGFCRRGGTEDVLARAGDQVWRYKGSLYLRVSLDGKLQSALYRSDTTANLMDILLERGCVRVSPKVAPTAANKPRWKNSTARTYLNPKGQPVTWTITTVPLTVTITCGHVDHPGEWVMHCRQMNIDTQRLVGVRGRKEAEQRALEFLASRLETWSSAVKQMQEATIESREHE